MHSCHLNTFNHTAYFWDENNCSIIWLGFLTLKDAWKFKTRAVFNEIFKIKNIVAPERNTLICWQKRWNILSWNVVAFVWWHVVNNIHYQYQLNWFIKFQIVQNSKIHSANKEWYLTFNKILTATILRTVVCHKLYQKIFSHIWPSIHLHHLNVYTICWK